MNQNDNQNPARDLQRYVCDYLNDELSGTGVTMLVEDSKNIEFEIQNALKKQGLAAICMTPTMTYLGKTGNGQAWQCNDLTLQFVEYVPVNRAKNKASFVSGFDAAFKCQRMLAGPACNCGFGKFCPVKIEQGEDDGLMVVKATFDTYFIDEYIAPPPPPEPVFKPDFYGDDFLFSDLVKRTITVTADQYIEGQYFYIVDPSDKGDRIYISGTDFLLYKSSTAIYGDLADPRVKAYRTFIPAHKELPDGTWVEGHWGEWTGDARAAKWNETRQQWEDFDPATESWYDQYLEGKDDFNTPRLQHKYGPVVYRPWIQDQPEQV